MTTAALPADMADNDHRGRVVGLSQLAKDWATFPDERERMIATPPHRARWWHRFTRRRNDLARIAAVVHALCDRDNEPIPDWVWEHRATKPVRFNHSDFVDSPYARIVRAEAPSASAYHDVWFTPRDIEDIRIHKPS